MLLPSTLLSKVTFFKSELVFGFRFKVSRAFIIFIVSQFPVVKVLRYMAVVGGLLRILNDEYFRRLAHCLRQYTLHCTAVYGWSIFENVHFISPVLDA